MTPEQNIERLLQIVIKAAIGGLCLVGSWHPALGDTRADPHDTYTLYREMFLPDCIGGAVHVATFDAAEGDEFATGICRRS